MRKLLSIFLVLVITLSLCACGGGEKPADKGESVLKSDYVYKDTFLENTNPENPTVMGLFYRNVTGAKIVSDDPAVLEVNKKADAMLEKIVDYPDSVKAAEGGNTYYLSNEGDDKNDGLTPEKARKTFDSIKTQLKAGDALLFRRGDIFRGKIELKAGVSYGAYGEGVKPRIYGSRDGKESDWVETDIEGVYEYMGITGDLSNIVFNSGEFIGRPIQNRAHITRKPLNYYLGQRLTLYSPDGKPDEIFHNIEIVDAYTLITGSGGKLENVKVQNLCVMYTGCHGFGALGRTYNFEIEGCIIGFCGGRDLPLGGISIGNGIEFWSVAEDIFIHDNYLFQCFDAGLTHQGPSGTVSADNAQTKSNNFTNIHYENNLLEYNTYDFEAFTSRSLSDQAKSPEGTFTYNDVYVKGNICRYTGWGWGSLDRPDKNVYATFKYDASGDVDKNGNYTNRHVKPLTIENNIFDRSRKWVLGISTPQSNSVNMILKNNQFIQTNRATVFNKETVNSATLEATLKKYFGTCSGNTYKLVK